MGRAREFRFRVGTRIATRRLELGLSQEGLARLLPGSTGWSTVSRWERGENFPRYDSMRALAKALGCSEEELLCGCEPSDKGR